MDLIHNFTSARRRRENKARRRTSPSRLAQIGFEQLENRQLLTTLTVNSVLDNMTANDGFVTLREAVLAANNDTATDLAEVGDGADVIAFDTGLVAGGPARIDLSAVGATAFGPTALEVRTDITIRGLSGNDGITIGRDTSVPNLRLFHVTDTGSLTLENLTLRDGRAVGGDGGTDRAGGGGGGAGLGGAILNEGSLTITSSILTANQALGGNGGNGSPNSGNAGLGGGPNGGVLSNDANLRNGGFGGGGAGGSRSSSVGFVGAGNGGFGGGGGGGGSPAGAGGFGAGPGGAPLTQNAGGGGGGAGLGGAIFNHGGDVNLTGTTLTGNTATGGLGGVGAGSASPGGDGGGMGGALFNRGGFTTITNVSMTNNTAQQGGGIHVLDTFGTTMTDSTVSGNTGSGVHFENGGGNILIINLTAENNTAEGLRVDGANSVTVSGGSFSNNAGNGFMVTDAAELNLSDVILGPDPNQNRGGFAGGVVSNTSTLRFTPTTGDVVDTVIVANGLFQHTRAGISQQPIEYINVDNLEVNGDGGSDTIDASAIDSPMPGQLNVVPASPFTANGQTGAFTNEQNLAFQGNSFARPAVAKDVIPGFEDIHRPEFANDGLYGNGASWIGNSTDSWLKIDLGLQQVIDRVSLGRDRLGIFDDRDPGRIIIEVAQTDLFYLNGNDSNDEIEYRQVFDSATMGFNGLITGPETLQASFAPVTARFIKLTVSNFGTAIDEVEVLPAFSARRSPSLTLHGGAGNDTIIGGSGNDRLLGGDGDDLLEGRDGNDNLFGQGGDDILRGGPGNDVLQGGDGNDVTEGGSGNDVSTDGEFFFGGFDNDPDGVLIHGTDGDDVIVIRWEEIDAENGLDDEEQHDDERCALESPACAHQDVLIVEINGESTRTIYTPQDDFETIIVFAGAGDDRVVMSDDGAGAHWRAEFHGEEGDDTLIGANELFGRLARGRDLLDGGPGNDHLEGGAGDDVLLGGDGDDVLHGGTGQDELKGQAGNDELNGDAGDDGLAGGEGHDELNGGRGDDNLSGGNGDDTLNGGRGDDELSGGEGQDQLNGGRGDDDLSGGPGNDTLNGGRGDDDLFDPDGRDELNGGHGDDLVGGIGQDDLAVLAAAILAVDEVFDINGDGQPDLADGREFPNIGVRPGDANLDGVFDSKDLVAIFQAGHFEDDVPENSTWLEGDFDGDGEFNTSDLVAAFQAGWYSTE